MTFEPGDADGNDVSSHRCPRGELELIDALLNEGADPGPELVTAISNERGLSAWFRLLDAGADLVADEQPLNRLLAHRTTEEVQRVGEKIGEAARMQHTLGTRQRAPDE